ncbi:unnamed protein product [Urochloa humidicola]
MSQKNLDKFEDFVDFLLLGRGGSVLDTFRLCAYENLAGHMHAGRWIHRAVACSLRALHVHHSDASDDAVHMPLDLGPSLTRLHLSNLSLDARFAESVSVNEMLSLVKASISYSCPDEEAVIQETQRKLVSNVGNVTTLELSDFLQIMVLDMEPDEFPAFRNLRNLLLDSG